MDKEELKAAQEVAENTRKQDAKTSNDVIVLVDGLKLDKKPCKKGDKITVTDGQKERLIAAEQVKEVVENGK